MFVSVLNKERINKISFPDSINMTFSKKGVSIFNKLFYSFSDFSSDGWKAKTLHKQAEKNISQCNQECIFMWNWADSSTVNFCNNYSFLLLFGAKIFQTAALISSHLCLLQQISRRSFHFLLFFGTKLFQTIILLFSRRQVPEIKFSWFYFYLVRIHNCTSAFFTSLVSPTTSGDQAFIIRKTKSMKVAILTYYHVFKK